MQKEVKSNPKQPIYKKGVWPAVVKKDEESKVVAD